jgi:hypothetical protein
MNASDGCHGPAIVFVFPETPRGTTRCTRSHVVVPLALSYVKHLETVKNSLFAIGFLKVFILLPDLRSARFLQHDKYAEPLNLTRPLTTLDGDELIVRPRGPTMTSIGLRAADLDEVAVGGVAGGPALNEVNLSLSVRLSVCLSVCLCVCLSVCLSVCLFVCLFICLSICLSVRWSICLSVCLIVCQCVSLPSSVLLYISLHFSSWALKFCEYFNACGMSLAWPQLT